ncbi:MAG: DNA translocase FtsK [Candidatus Coproplasma sp.]
MKKKNKSDKSLSILTKETFGITLLLFCVLVFIMLLSNKVIFLGVGSAVCTFMYGTFGYGSYFIVAMLAYLGVWLAFEKKIKLKARCILSISATVFFLFLLFHTVSTNGFLSLSFKNYIRECYFNASNGYSGYTLGGVISGLIVYPVAQLLTPVGTYVVFSAISVLFLVLTFMFIRNIYFGKVIEKAGSKPERKSSEAENKDNPQPQKEVYDKLYSVNDDYEIVTNVKAKNTIEASAPSRAEGNGEKSEDDDKFSQKNLGRKILFQNGEFAAESYRRNMIYNDNSYFNHPVHNDDDYIKSFRSGDSKKNTESYTDSYSSDVLNGSSANSAPSYVYGDKPVSSLDFNGLENKVENYTNYTVKPKPVSEIEDEKPDFNEFADNDNLSDGSEELNLGDEREINSDNRIFDSENNSPANDLDHSQTSSTDSMERDNGFSRSASGSELDGLQQNTDSGSDRGRSVNLFNIFNSSNSRLVENSSGVEPDASVLSNRDRSRENLFDDNDSSDGNLFADEKPLTDRDSIVSDSSRESRVEFDRVKPVTGTQHIGISDSSRGAVPVPQPKPVAEEKPKHVWKKYVRPTLDLLDDYPENNNVNTGEIEENKSIICETLANFRIDSRVANVVVGPAITRYDVIIEDRTNIKNALKYRDAIAMALMKENVNAYLNYAKGAISIEVPNSRRTTVGLKGMLASSQFINAKPNALAFALGKDVDGQVVCPDITKMPHLLVAGTTGSGKSICLSALIISLLYKYGPEELRFILVDPKQVEFISYDKLPHLMINEIIYDIDKAMKALNWAIKEMERRYSLFKEMTENGIATKNLTEYNSHLPEGEEKLPKIVIILDEFGDLMLQAKKEIESRIIRLVQKARACGIHLILATQRPSVDCITGLIKSNLPTRIGFKVNSFDDSRCIFDIGGAEKLLGKGDLYFRSAETPDLARIQGCFIDTHEVQRVTDFIKKNNETYFDDSVSDFINKVEEEPSDSASSDGEPMGDTAKVDDTFIKALWFCVTSNQASVSMIQRRFPIGYMKACKIIDWMENMNYITQPEGSKPRKVLLSRDEFIQKYGEPDD